MPIPDRDNCQVCKAVQASCFPEEGGYYCLNCFRHIPAGDIQKARRERAERQAEERERRDRERSEEHVRHRGVHGQDFNW